MILKSGDAFGAAIAEVHGCQNHPPPRCEAGNILSDFNDLTRNVAAQDVRQVYAGQSLAHPEVEMIQRASPYPD